MDVCSNEDEDDALFDADSGISTKRFFLGEDAKKDALVSFRFFYFFLCLDCFLFNIRG